MQTFLVICLGIVALASFLQTVLLVRLGVAGLRLQQAGERAHARLSHDLEEPRARLALALRHLRSAGHEMRSAREDVARVVGPPSTEIKAWAAALVKGIAAYRRYRGPRGRNGREDSA